MPERVSSIFNQKATEKLRSPDDLDKYVRVTNPSVWVVLVACIAMLLALLAWGIFGAVTTSVSTTGTCVDGRAVCFLSAEDMAKVNVGDAALVGGKSMQVSALSAVPLSRDEASPVLKSDYLVSTLFQGDWAYQVDFEGESSELASSVPLSVNITTERVAPLSLILGGNA
ncbi:MAG: hypothetical protein IJ113_00585 [Eggerthellaceae bacterium]|nr:hypothetical protein [Eggerthellaceae bacterium]